jgi:non-ribosomal peptide synthetase component E (peptide arylation enzyme)
MHQITDTFVSGGAIGGRQNIAPSDAAELMGTHHKIIDASEAGMPDEEMGERVCA